VRRPSGRPPSVASPSLCPQVFSFLEAVLEEVLDLFPSRHIHVGGDECPKDAWAACPKCQARIKSEGLADEGELQSWFLRRVAAWLRARGRRLVGWDEILEGGLPEDATVMSWRGIGGGVRAAELGHEVIMSPATHTYLDYRQGTAAHEPGAWYAMLPLEATYMFDPVPTYDMYLAVLPGWADTAAMREWRATTYPESAAASLTEATAAKIIGAQANLWTEYVSSQTQVEYMLLPRLCAFTEAVWSPSTQRHWPSFQARLPTLLGLFDSLGVNYRPLDATEGSPIPEDVDMPKVHSTPDLLQGGRFSAPVDGAYIAQRMSEGGSSNAIDPVSIPDHII